MASSILGDLEVFPNDVLLQQVLSCLGPRSLLKIASINSIFEKLASDDYLWKDFTIQLWKNKAIVCTGIVIRPKPRTYPYAKIVLTPTAYTTLSALELKYILRSRHVDVRGLCEKKEFVDLAVKSNKLKLGSGVPPLPRPLRDKWKCSFYLSLRDGHRARAIKEDICTYKWSMAFKQNQNAPEWESSFHPDWTISSTPDPNPNQTMTWCFYGENDEYIRVGQYPPLIITRLNDWSWRMENQYVFFLRTNEKL